MPLQPLPVVYAGIRFPSRTVARWAIFLDHLKIEWEYEPDAYDTDEGPYVPTFKVKIDQVKNSSSYHQFFTVEQPGSPHGARHVAFARATGLPLIVARQMPRSYADQFPRGGRLLAYNLMVDNSDNWPVQCSFVNVDQPALRQWCALGDNRHWCQEDFGFSMASRTHLAVECPGSYSPPAESPVVDEAFVEARSARFVWSDGGDVTP